MLRGYSFAQSVFWVSTKNKQNELISFSNYRIPHFSAHVCYITSDIVWHCSTKQTLFTAINKVYVRDFKLKVNPTRVMTVLFPIAILCLGDIIIFLLPMYGSYYFSSSRLWGYLFSLSPSRMWESIFNFSTPYMGSIYIL